MPKVMARCWRATKAPHTFGGAHEELEMGTIMDRLPTPILLHTLFQCPILDGQQKLTYVMKRPARMD